MAHSKIYGGAQQFVCVVCAFAQDDGCTCRKDVHIFAKSSYGRGAGNLLTCSSDLEYDAGKCT